MKPTNKPWPRFLSPLRRRVQRRKEAMAKEMSVDTSMRDALLKAIHEIEACYQSEGQEQGLRTGFADFDRLTSGCRPGELVVIASVPGMGKTVLGLNIATHVALKDGAAVAVFSLENSRQELTQRILCSQSGVPLNRVRSGGLSPERDFPRLQHAAERLAGARILVEDPAELTTAGLRKRLRDLKQQYDVKLVVIDYFQLLCESEGNEEEAAAVARELKRMAREFKVVILTLAQLESPGAERNLGRPRVADLRPGRGVERHADVISLLWRQDLFETRPEDYDPDFTRASLILTKNRNGALGEVPLLFRKEVPRFENRALEGQSS